MSQGEKHGGKEGVAGWMVVKMGEKDHGEVNGCKKEEEKEEEGKEKEALSVI